MEELAEAKRKKWRQENRDASPLQRVVEKHGTFSDGVRASE